MPQKLDLTPINEAPSKLNLTPVDNSQANNAPSQGASPGFLQSISDYIPAPVKSLWSAANTSAFDYLPSAIDPSNIARGVTSYFDPNNRDPFYASTATKFAGDVLHGLPTPLNVGTMGAFGLEGPVAEAGYPLLAKGLRTVGGALSAPVAAEGAYNVAAGKTLPEKVLGGLELAGGALGVHSGFSGTRVPKTTFEANEIPSTGKVHVPADNVPETIKEQARGAEPANIVSKAPEAPTSEAIPESLKTPPSEKASPEQAAILEKFGIKSEPPPPTEEEQALHELIQYGHTDKNLPPGGGIRTNYRPELQQYLRDVRNTPGAVEGGYGDYRPTGEMLPVTPEMSAKAPEMPPESPKAKVTEQRVVFDENGNSRTLTPQEADNYEAQPGETYGVLRSNGTFVSLNDLGGKPPDNLRIVRPRRREYPGFQRPTTDATIGTDLQASLQDRLGKATGTPTYGTTPLSASELDPNIPIEHRPVPPEFNQSMFSQIWNTPRALQSIDLPGITSAALRQSRPLSFTKDWFQSWGEAARAFGSKEALDVINNNIKNSKYFKPMYMAKYDAKGNITAYKELPSYVERIGLKTTDVLSRREESIASSLAERIPGYGRYVAASNRAYTAFLNNLRMTKLEQMIDGAKALGRDPETDLVLGKKIADYINNATGRGRLPKFGKVDLENIAEGLGDALYSPRALSARLQFMNPGNYIMEDPLIRKEYWKSLARIVGSWGAFSGLGAMAGGYVSNDPTNADFGKIRFGNTRIDPGAGFQQLLVLTSRELAGGSTASTSAPGQPGKYSPFGMRFNSSTRLSVAGKYLYNQLNPSLRYAFDLLSASRSQPFDLTDRTLQLALPMFVTDITDAAQEDNTVAEVFAPLLSSAGAGVQSYEKGSMGRPTITPFINQVLGTQIPTHTFGR